MASQYPKNVTTKKGLSLIAESIATKQPITFTRVVVGDGDVPVGKSLNDINTVTAPRMELPVTAGVNEGNGQFKITATLSNRELEVGFFPKEVGMYAKIGNGEEILYCYTNGGNNVGYIPDKTTPIESEVYNIRTNIGNAKDILITLKDDTYLTIGDLQLHNIDSNAHNDIRTKITNDIAAHNNDKNAHKVITDAIKALKGTSAFDTNVSKSVTEIITLLGMGGIVAAKLDANAGFVKFANGFIIQWGNVVIPDNSYYADFTLPIACNVVAGIASDTTRAVSTRMDSISIGWNIDASTRTKIRLIANVSYASLVTYIVLGTNA